MSDFQEQLLACAGVEAERVVEFSCGEEIGGEDGPSTQTLFPEVMVSDTHSPARGGHHWTGTFPNGLAQQHIPPDAQGYALLSTLIVALPMGS